KITSCAYYDEKGAILAERGRCDMIGINEENLCGIPSLSVVDKANEAKALPVLVYFHGFTSAKEHNLSLAFLMAKKGFRVILPDSLYHGERDEGLSADKLRLSFWDIVIKNVDEVKTIHDELNQRGLIRDERFGIAGTSMGGITTAAALTRYQWIKAAAVLMGSPKLTSYAEELIQTYKQSGDLHITDE